MCLHWDREKPYSTLEDDLLQYVLSNPALSHDAHGMDRRDLVDRYLDIDMTDQWCPWCLAFADGLRHKPLSKATMCIGHSYSNPIWLSPYHFYFMNVLSGIKDTEITSLFEEQRDYRELCERDLQALSQSIIKISEISSEIELTQHDQYAIQETERVMDFLNTWLRARDVVVIYEYEC
ncbi:hypothetical protein EON63_17070 [archaeon]|nr:MAG: hypothetical protein EON63_17070 [archaeon]